LFQESLKQNPETNRAEPESEDSERAGASGAPEMHKNQNRSPKLETYET
jgi:hypothetical protein